MKKTIASLLAATLCLSLIAAPVSAATYNQDSTETPGTTISFDYKNDPTYTVTIPDSVTLDKDGAEMQIEASDVADLGNQKISVTIAGTQYFRNQLVLEGVKADGKDARPLRYQVIKEDGTVIETTGTDTATGTELASFTDNGTATLKIVPVINDYTDAGVAYTGTMTYGIALVDAE